MIRYYIVAVAFIFLAGSESSAWTGYDYDRHTYADIKGDNLVREGKEIEIYDYDDHQYKKVKIDKINKRRNKVEIQVIEKDNGEKHTIVMK